MHPLNTIHRMICDYWNQQQQQPNDDDSTFTVFDNISPIVSTTDCFDMLRIPPDHVSRKMSDTYYVNRDTVLRPHTSAHQVELLQRGLDRFLVTGDVYRRDEIDKSHYPVFHQMEGVKMFPSSQLQGLNESQRVSLIEDDLKQGLEGMARHLFGPVQMRWASEHFPFTEPSFELEIMYDGEWMEVLGCGVIHPDIVRNAGREGESGWAFGLGLERLAMVLFQIPDIRLFWTDDDRFHRQFASGQIVTFKPYSKYPACLKDISFWIPDSYFHVNDLNEVVRDVAGDLVEQLELVDQFTHPKTNRTSHCYRITYRSMDRSLTNAEIDGLQEQVRVQTVNRLNVELR
jgi:phenylalanyl-tRNA synthetase alpha chain